MVCPRRDLPGEPLTVCSKARGQAKQGRPDQTDQAGGRGGRKVGRPDLRDRVREPHIYQTMWRLVSAWPESRAKNVCRRGRFVDDAEI
ncbi:hypothetical protein E2C01_090080 [Portunus trituberculatus]|uniref:Uncharacterized protein n=1 Tax=Portunus trituberculatus TaxID=210409 RepID=A0A5B7JDR2_PORTR|nr:hypothetical protein [Portunus trituberculatus]